MTGLTFDAFTRQLGRRRAIQSLGAAAVATASGLTLADARNGSNKQKNKKQKKKIQKQAIALCESQAQQCITLITAGCNGDAECLARGQQCCAFLGACDFSGLITCLQTPPENESGRSVARLK